MKIILALATLLAAVTAQTAPIPPSFPSWGGQAKDQLYQNQLRSRPSPTPFQPPFPPLLPPPIIVDPIFGLTTNGSDPVPLQSVTIDAQVYGFFADVATNLSYFNPGDEPLEVQFVFPLDASSALYKMQAHCDHTITAEIKEKEEARAEYQQALENGQQASLLEEDDKHSDVLTLKLGNIKPGQECWAEFSFVQDLDLLQESLELQFAYPIVLGERYNDHPATGGEITNLPQHVSPDEIEYTWDFILEVVSPKDVEITPVGNSFEWDISGSVATLRPNQILNNNVALNIRPKELQPYQVIEAGSGPSATCDDGDFSETFMEDSVVMLNLLPDFGESQKEALNQEYVVVLDRSGSMSGQRIQQAILTVNTFLDKLKDVEVCTFNILSFGSDHELMFPEAMPCSREQVENAKAKISSFNADMGGTELYQTLVDLFAKNSVKPQRQVFLVTDGEIMDTQRTIDLVETNSRKNRIFSFGIGAGVSTELVQGVAKFGGASRILREDETDKLSVYVQRALKASQTSWFFDLDLDLHLNSGLCGKVTSMDNAIFPGEVFSVFLMVRGDVPDHGSLGTATLTANAYDGSDLGNLDTVLKEFHFDLSVAQPVVASTMPLHRCAAKRIIQDLKYGKDKDVSPDEKNEKMLAVSLASNVLSPVTSFLAVDHDAPPVNGTSTKVVVPVVQDPEYDSAPRFAKYSSGGVGGGTSFAANVVPMAPMAPPMQNGAVPNLPAPAPAPLPAPRGWGASLWTEHMVYSNSICGGPNVTELNKHSGSVECSDEVWKTDECGLWYFYNDATQECFCSHRCHKQTSLGWSVYKLTNLTQTRSNLMVDLQWKKAETEETSPKWDWSTTATVAVLGLLVGVFLSLLVSWTPWKSKASKELEDIMMYRDYSDIILE